MAALKARQPRPVPLPQSSESPTKSTSRKGKLKGKEKEKESTSCATPRKRKTQPIRGSSIIWDWTTLTDPSPSRTPPVYTKDGSYFFSLVGSSIRIYSVPTGQVVSTLSAPPSTNLASESSLLTSAILSPWNPFQLITGSLDGRIMIWDFLDASLLQTIDIAQPIHYVCAHENFKDSIFVAVSKMNVKKNDDGVVLQVSLNPDTDRQSGNRKSPVIAAIGKTRFPTGLAFSPSGAWLVATAAHKVYVVSSSSLKSGFVKYVSPERLTCLAFHPFEDYFATGDQKGVIRLWYCLNESLAINVKGVEKRTQTAPFHWHAHAISSIAFTPNGAYLLSGGEEAVLVIWQLSSGKKEFVPRLGAPINTISVSKMSGQESYLVGLADATFTFISPGSLRVSRSSSGIKLDPSPSYGSRSPQGLLPIAVHDATSTLILPSSHPSSLQIYSPFSSKLLYELEVTPSNRVSRRDEKPLEPPRVDRVTVSSSGQWMATIDGREEDETFHGEIYLKIWFWDSKSGDWILNTRIHRPHGQKKVTDLSFSPSQAGYLATIGEDGKVKIWGVRAAKNKAGQAEEYWVTRTTFNFRSQVPNSVSWSFDASLLAISLGPHVAVYDPQINAIRQTISSPEWQAITVVRFIGKGGRYLAFVGQRDLTVWDLVLGSVQWSYRTSAPIKDVIPHPYKDTFAVFHDYPASDSTGTVGLTFHVKSPLPTSEHTIPYRLQSIALFAPSKAAFNFVGVDTRWAVISFGEQPVRPDIESISGNKICAEATAHRRTLFQDIFGISAFEHWSPEQPSLRAVSTAVIPRSKTSAGVFDGPSHQLPSISTIFDTIMSDFVHTRPPSPPPPSKADEDVDMEIDIPEMLVAQNKQARLVAQEEVDILVDLFKTHTVDVQSTTHSTDVNGKGAVQSKAVANGKIHYTPSPEPSVRKPVDSKPKSVAPKPPHSIPPSSPTVTPTEATPQQPKKRKKSIC